MELGNLVWFSSRAHPFAVRERHCLDLDCSCTDAWLTFTEVDLRGGELEQPLTFDVQVNLRNGRERRRPRRPAEIDALVREFLVRFPTAGFQQMIERRHQQRMIEQRLRTYRAEPSRKGEVLCYSEVVHEQGGVAQSSRHFGFFFALDGHDYLIEDHYCVNPACDCRTVHLEFWERTESGGRSPRVGVEQLLMATVTLAGDFQRIDFSKESRQVAEKIARAWCDRCGHQLPEIGRRYEQVKAIGRRSFPADTDTARRRSSAAAARKGHVPAAAPPSDAGVGRNDPCPCGSGRKFKRCCARR